MNCIVTFLTVLASDCIASCLMSPEYTYITRILNSLEGIRGWKIYKAGLTRETAFRHCRYVIIVLHIYKYYSFFTL